MDRSQRMHNPNYPPNLQYAHPIPQPPAQPAADPFPRTRRDPFLANPSSEKRDPQFAHGLYGSNGASRIETLQPAPAPPPSLFHSGRGSTYRDDHGRRSSLSYASGPLEPPLPPPPPLPGVMSRQMPPPASSPKQSPGPSYSHSLSRGSLPNPSSFNPGRDPGPGYPSHRPSSSMSIQSIMGSDSGIAPKGPPLWAPFGGSRTPQTGSGPYTLPSSPQYDRRPGFPNELAVEPRSRTPERRVETQYGGPFVRPSNATSPTGLSNPQGGPPDHHNTTRGMQPNHHHSAPSNSAIPPRPFSQPVGPEAGGRNQSFRYGYEQGPPPPPRPQVPPGDRNIHGPSHSNGTFEKAPRDRSMSDIDVRKGPLLSQPFQRSMHEPNFMPSAPSTQLDHPPYSRRQEHQNGISKPDGVVLSHYPNSHDILRPRSPPTSQSAILPNTQTSTAPPFPPAYLPIDQASMNRPAIDRQERASFASSAPTSDGGQNGTQGGRRTPAIDAQLRKSIEENQAAQRSFLSIASDHARGLDRASPLPQAVQGAQSQPVGSNRDPSIKSEFGRMFSGLGSGVGSTPVPSSAYAPPTPANRSPLLEDGEGEMSMRKASVGSRGPPVVAARGGRRGKRAYDDEGRVDSESGDGRATPVGSLRGGKRNKYTLPGHHHHHVPHNLHHHHIHRKADDETTPAASHTPGTSPFTTFKFPATTPANSATTAAVPHHHHHHHPPVHHHHHPPKATNPAPQAPALRLPTTTILTKPLVQSVSHLPRHHLGSQLYAPSVEIPSTSSTTLGSSTTYSTVPNSLPRFEGRENCTFTIRVPRYYLTHGPRENICNARRVWGTDVYTDDSDPIAAAIHSGWIRGAWAKNVDVDLLTFDPTQAPDGVNAAAAAAAEPEDTEATTTTTTTTKQPEKAKTDATTTPTKRLTSPPSTGPTEPPANMDMHLTLLILPTLEKYTLSVWHGVKSRAWGRNHDGMSFKVESVEWVDEGWEGRGRERGAEARRRRLVEGVGGGKGLVGVLEGLRTGGRVGGVGVGVGVGGAGKRRGGDGAGAGGLGMGLGIGGIGGLGRSAPVAV